MEPLRPRRRPTPWPNLTPMIDVVFLLVVFFMISTTFTERESALALELPTSAAAPSEARPDDLVLELDAEGMLFIDGEAVEDDALERRLADPAGDDGAVVLRADAAVPHGRVVEVLDRCRALGIDSLAIATQSVESAER